MNAKEKYNTIIYKIEEMIMALPNNPMKPIDIGEEAFRSADLYMEPRERNAIFKFMVGQSLNEYIRQRCMFASYRVLITDEKLNCAIQKSIVISGVENQSSFNKKFRQFFGTTPGEVFNTRNCDRLSQACDWDKISLEGQEMFEKINDGSVNRNEMYGIDNDKLAIAQICDELKGYYDFNDLESDTAFSIFQNRGYSLDETFYYVYKYVFEKFDFTDGYEGTKRDEFLQKDLLNEDVLYLYFECKFGFDLIHFILYLKYKNYIKGLIREMSRFELIAEYQRYLLLANTKKEYKYLTQIYDEDWSNDTQSGGGYIGGYDGLLDFDADDAFCEFYNNTIVDSHSSTNDEMPF